ncbi:plasmid transfer protein [Streptomyces cinnamoneus]|uniref:Plasmid transfer protein n=1 Tax=Streptomyces cinnamoneus TaxID=53446 RepID=A0A2G1XGF3_STRCJ|nr:FtsK/SpoIIIE domain-containing protein [Streptomyces cinnamoneus]PHQ50316.1 plasmid transfer protein [Streptomyces cinnamoneus]PPT12897.1 plasmid transfer protein [Streptomyces cinnamoneus]
MSGLVVTLLVVFAVAGLLRWWRPTWYWLTFGATFAALRVLVRYSSVMDACRLTVPPSRWRMALARFANRPISQPRVPRLLRLRPTRTGLVLRLKLCPGQDAFDVAAATDRLRHSFVMYRVMSQEVRSGVVELRMTGYDVLKRVQMPSKVDRASMRVPVALREDGSVHYRDYRAVPHALTIGATESGKSVYLRNLVAELAKLDVALAGIDCKQGVELFPLARRFSALADNSDTAADLLDALVSRMGGVYQLIRAEQRIAADVPDAEIAADIWDLPDDLRPTPVVVVVDEVAELALVASKDEEKRRDRCVTALVRLSQLGRAAGIYLEICGQRFGSELGKGITMLRAQLTGRTAHRVNDESSANMAFGDIAPDAALAAIHIPPDRPGVAIAGDSTGGWSRIRAPHISLRQVVNVCNRYAHLTPDLPELAPFRPALPHSAKAPAPAVETAPTTV